VRVRAGRDAEGRAEWMTGLSKSTLHHRKSGPNRSPIPRR
jgi:hypothetical protein